MQLAILGRILKRRNKDISHYWIARQIETILRHACSPFINIELQKKLLQMRRRVPDKVSGWNKFQVIEDSTTATNRSIGRKVDKSFQDWTERKTQCTSILQATFATSDSSIPNETPTIRCIVICFLTVSCTRSLCNLIWWNRPEYLYSRGKSS